MQTTHRPLENMLSLTDKVALCGQCAGILERTDDETSGVCARCNSAESLPRTLPGDAGALVLALAASLDEPGEYLCFDDGAAVVVIPLSREWTRIGRSLTADVRFEDCTVSRRHALIVRGPDGLRLLDDGSLNGVFLNGQRTQSGLLIHGDEICVGRHSLLYGVFEPFDMPAAHGTYDNCAADARVAIPA